MPRCCSLSASSYTPRSEQQKGTGGTFRLSLQDQVPRSLATFQYGLNTLHSSSHTDRSVVMNPAAAWMYLIPRGTEICIGRHSLAPRCRLSHFPRRGRRWPPLERTRGMRSGPNPTAVSHFGHRVISNGTGLWSIVAPGHSFVASARDPRPLRRYLPMSSVGP